MQADYDAAGVRVIGVSPDPLKSHVKFRDKHGLPFTLLSDPEHETAEAYGVWVQKSMYGRTYMGVERSTFLIGPDGVLREALYKVKPKGHAASLLELATT
jgi:peroxiredoxin Q/BCP